MLIDLFRAALICFDLETDPEAAAAEAAAAESAATARKAAFTADQQEAVNRLLAEERRKTEVKADKKAAHREETRIQELLTERNLTEQARSQLETELENTRKRLRTKEENEKHERKQFEDQYTKKLTEAEKRAQDAESKYKNSKKLRALQDAAIQEDAHNPNLVVTYLEGKTQFNDETEEVMVELTVPTDEGKEEPLLLTPLEAVKRMKTMVNQFGGLFKSNLVSGVGGTSGVGGGTGKLDVSKLSTEEYMRVRKESPEKLGLKPRR